MLSQPSPPIWQSGDRHLHSTATRSQSTDGWQGLPVHQFLTDVLWLHSPGNSLRDEVCDFLAGQDVPDAVTGQNDEVPVWLDYFVENIGKTGHNLLTLRQLIVHFEHKVSQGARQGQVAVDSVEFHKSSSRLDSLSLLLVL